MAQRKARRGATGALFSPRLNALWADAYKEEGRIGGEGAVAPAQLNGASLSTLSSLYLRMTLYPGAFSGRDI